MPIPTTNDVPINNDNATIGEVPPGTWSDTGTKTQASASAANNPGFCRFNISDQLDSISEMAKPPISTYLISTDSVTPTATPGVPHLLPRRDARTTAPAKMAVLQVAGYTAPLARTNASKTL
jgi:hypothetical protein